ncbi:TIGR03943 family putative permease subunit [Halalkalibacillus halophilus]|uniref:TIGR03943 family putative permease subunit n=1 Tax=Halalkalibacillus halophilus TaxID=392827 RepID=UPI0004201B10|nr:TIGR03943 family protein [Halalkalibacillus halophilus]
MSKSAHIFLRAVILLGFTLLLFKLIVTGDISRFIAPRMMPYFYFALVVMAVLGTIQLFRIDNEKAHDHDHHEACNCAHDHDFKGSKKKFTFVYGLFVIPIFSGLLFSNHALGSSQAEIMGFKHELRQASESGIYAQEVVPEDEEEIESDTKISDSEISDGDMVEAHSDDEFDEYQSEDVHGSGEEVGYEDANLSTNQTNQEDQDDVYEETGLQYLTPSVMYPELDQRLREAEHIEITDENYIGVISLLEEDPSAFEGKTVSYIGFVFREGDFKENQVVAGRFGITCCTADAGIFGLIATDERFQDITNDTWVRITGTLGTEEYRGWQLTTVEPESIDVVEEPDNPYVYEQFDYEEFFE